jgi:hypothetical protein
MAEAWRCSSKGCQRAATQVCIGSRIHGRRPRPVRYYRCDLHPLGSARQEPEPIPVGWNGTASPYVGVSPAKAVEVAATERLKRIVEQLHSEDDGLGLDRHTSRVWNNALDAVLRAWEVGLSGDPVPGDHADPEPSGDLG